MSLERPLDPLEVRVLGSLLEKQLATPDYYPLTLNALVAAASQKSNREPVMELDGGQVQGALRRLQELQLVWEIHGGRATRYDHRLDGRWGLSPATRALVALLFLRGAQTAGELRTRSERLHRFETIEQVEEELRYLSRGDEALVRNLPRRPGQKENRWAHLAGGAVAEDESPMPAPQAAESQSLTSRVQRLEAEVEQLRAQLEGLGKARGKGSSFFWLLTSGFF
ncbi:MAG: YceH family protein [Thermoanaerobaculia bacterium]